MEIISLSLDDETLEELEVLMEEVDGDENTTRRQFLKALGLGAGALGLSSAVSGFTQLRNVDSGDSKDPTGDADKLDGEHASDLGRMVSYDSGGSVLFTSVGTPTVTTGATGNNTTTGTTASERVIFSTATVTVANGQADLTLYRNNTGGVGSTLTNQSNVGTNTDISVSGTLTTGTTTVKSPSWTLSATFDSTDGGTGSANLTVNRNQFTRIY